MLHSHHKRNSDRFVEPLHVVMLGMDTQQNQAPLPFDRREEGCHQNVLILTEAGDT